MRAGQGGLLVAGGQLTFAEVKSLMLRASVGFKYNTTAAENANIRLTRIPLVLMPFWAINEDFRLGAGITSHQGIIFKGDGFLPDIDYTSTVGPRLEFGWRWIAITYTSINYESEFGDSLSAGSIGAFVSYAFPNK